MPAESNSAVDFLPARRTLSALASAAEHCRGCDLYRNATQIVFGEGSKRADLIVIGEQPGDREDLEGKPFVGPAGRLLDDVFEEAGLQRSNVYVTNAVKHFKWEPRGKRRLHKKPSARELKACLPWLEAEFEAVRPQGVVCLGATAAQTVFGRDFRVSRQRGDFVETEWADWGLATWHPSAVLRAPDKERRAEMRQELIDDFRRCRASLL